MEGVSDMLVLSERVLAGSWMVTVSKPLSGRIASRILRWCSSHFSCSCWGSESKAEREAAASNAFVEGLAGLAVVAVKRELSDGAAEVLGEVDEVRGNE